MTATILIIDDEESIRFTFKAFLEKDGFRVLTADDFEPAMELLAREQTDLIFADIVLTNHTGIDVLREVKQRELHCPVVMITGQPSIETAAECVRSGAFDYLQKPVSKEELLRVTAYALRHKFLEDAKRQAEVDRERYRRHLEAIFRSVQEGIITVDTDMRIIEANAAVEKIFHVNHQEITGKKFNEILPESYQVCCNVVQETLETKQGVREYRVELRHEHYPRQIAIMNSAPLIDQEQRFVGAVLVLRDITRLSELESALRERHQFQNLIGKNSTMQKIYRLLEDLADTETTVLITGASGTGKELVAEAIHYSGPRALKPLVKVNCSALSENLLESELFGHVKGAFTGAIRDKIGRFQAADCGTIFLDEIGDISPVIQLKLLRVLQEKVFERVGDAAPLKVDVRVIAATNRDLKERVRRGEFREDLYYRLKVVEITLPRLRERLEDIPLLVEHFCTRFNKSFNKNITGITDEVLAVFMNYDWPGNIRELEHAIEHGFVLCHGQEITCEHLPQEIKEWCGDALQTADASRVLTQDIIIGTLQKCGWNKAKAARSLGVSRQTMYRKISEFNIREPTPSS